MATQFRAPARVAPAAVIAAALLIAAVPGTAFAGECGDKAWARYNRCLVLAESWLGKKACDIDFIIDMYFCGESIN